MVPITAPEAVSESAIGEPVGQFEFAGRRYSRSMLNYLLGLNFAKRNIEDLSVDTVVELGGGFGSLGEVLLSDPRNGTFYVDVDIPPTAVYATYYLSELLGSSRVIDYAQVRDEQELELDTLRQKGDAAVLPSWLLPRMTGVVDLFVNPAYQVLRDFREHEITHRAIRPTNVYTGGSDKARFTIGECVTAAPAIAQPVVYEPIESCLCMVAGRSGHHTALLFLVGERSHLRGGAPDLEGVGALEVLALQVDLAVRGTRKGRRRFEGCASCPCFDIGPNALDELEI